MYSLRRLIRGPTLVRDRGYAWVILALSFLSHMFHLGFNYAVVGNLTIAHKKFFNISLQQSSLMGSVHMSLLCCFGPVASIMVKKLGCRIAHVVGGICLILSLGLSSLSTEYWHAFLLFGVLTGIGISITYTASSAILALHFEKYKYLAFSLAVLGFYIGMSFWPTVSQLMLDKFGYSKAMGLMAIPQIVHVIAGILFYEPNLTSTAESSKEVNGFEASQKESCSSKATTSQEMVKPDDVKFNQVTSSEQNEGEQRNEDKNLLHNFLTLLRSAKVWSLLANALFWNANVASFLILVNDYILHRTGATEEEIALGITFLGIANIFGCVLVIVTSSLLYDRVTFQFFCILTYAISTILTAFTADKVMFYVLCCCWGIGNGASIANLLAVIYNFCDMNLIAVLLGLNLLAEGIGALAGTSLCSYIAEQANPMVAIILSGVFGVVGSCFLLPVMVIKLRRRLQKKTATSNSSPGSEKEIGVENLGLENKDI